MRLGSGIVGLLCGLAAACAAAAAPPPWADTKLSPDERARLLEQAMTPEERLSLLHGPMAMPFFGPMPAGALGSAGFIPGVPRLGIPALQESDASLGLTNPQEVRPKDGGTPLPSGLATAATFDTGAAFANGAMIGRETWNRGFNVLLNGGANLARDPRNGRNFEYLGEDPLLTGTLAGEAIRGIQSTHVISTAKHYALNDQETLRHSMSAKISEAAMRESDLLAFEIAIERGRPGSVMCAYNRINGDYACDSDHLLNDILKRDWDYPGWVMSDWGAVPGVDAALHGLDQQSGQQIDPAVFFDAPLKAAAASGHVPAARISDMTRRILRSMFAAGLFDTPQTLAPIDHEAGAAVAQRAAEEGTVLLKNAGGLLPLGPGARRIVVIGGFADSGVLAGGGSSQVIPAEGVAVRVPVAGEGDLPGAWRAMVFHPSSPLKAIRALAPQARVTFVEGSYPSAAAAAARDADVAIVFATQWMTEGDDAPDLTLPGGQDQLIAAVAAANPHTVVVLETGGPVLMPWLDGAGAVLEAWYPGERGGEAIARVLFGQVDSSGRLPITFPTGVDQLPRPALPGAGLAPLTKIDVDYDIEGSDVGYRWFARQGLKPLFAFGYGLSYTHFTHGGLELKGGGGLTASFDVANDGARPGADVPQLYLVSAAGKPVKRLIGFARVSLAPGETRRLTLTADPRLLGRFDAAAGRWRIEAGEYRVAVGMSAEDLGPTASVRLSGRTLKP